MKKLLATLLIGLTLGSTLVGCGDSIQKQQQANQEQKQEEQNNQQKEEQKQKEEDAKNKDNDSINSHINKNEQQSKEEKKVLNPVTGQYENPSDIPDLQEDQQPNQNFQPTMSADDYAYYVQDKLQDFEDTAWSLYDEASNITKTNDMKDTQDSIHIYLNAMNKIILDLPNTQVKSKYREFIKETFVPVCQQVLDSATNVNKAIEADSKSKLDKALKDYKELLLHVQKENLLNPLEQN